MGDIPELSTGGAVSKFGFPLLEVRQQLVDAFVKHPWLNMLHLHVGSQVGRWLGMLPTKQELMPIARAYPLIDGCNGFCRVPGNANEMSRINVYM